MKIPLTAVMLAAVVMVLPAQSDAAKPLTQAELRSRRDAKRAAPFLRKRPWHLEFAAARTAAKESGKPILVYFTRSYAPSPPCEAVEEQLLIAPEFSAVAARVELFCHISSRVDEDPDQDLFTRFGAESYPHIGVTDDGGRPIANLDRISSIADIKGVLDGDVAAFQKLQQAAAKGGKAAKAAFFMKRLQLGHLAPAQIEKELRTADYLSESQRKVIRRSLANLEVMEIMAGVDTRDPASQRQVAQRLLAMVRAERIPSDRYAFPFWQVLLGHADQTEDVELFTRALASIQRIGGDKIDAEWSQRMETRLRAMRFLQQRRKDK